ncbi:hypothetical protein Bca52824_086693 [Brassica carinata]|uniref:Uncharacterized protein n=1 Tax=Brassica carinata TaxID=52824 RepID=A0A8X7TM37_BRACI|nr:hypothetical protein Bca52824_086693 [Brassica carinata]
MDKAQQTIKHKTQKKLTLYKRLWAENSKRKTVEETQADKSPPRVRSPSDQWKRVRPRRNLLPPEKKRRYDGSSAVTGEGERDRSEAREERRLSDEAAGNANHKNRENPGEEPPSTLKRRDAETKAGRPSLKEKAKTPEAESAATTQKKVRLQKQRTGRRNPKPVEI